MSTLPFTPMIWEPFYVQPRPDLMRALNTPEGVGDRLRAAAFAEKQAYEAFLWAASFYTDASVELQEAWRKLAKEELKHLEWLLTRLEELNQPIQARAVSDALWKSFQACTTAHEFTLYMANAEERGRIAGEKFYISLKSIDLRSAEIFRTIALEEQAHIEIAQRFYSFRPQIVSNSLMNA